MPSPQTTRLSGLSRPGPFAGRLFPLKGRDVYSTTTISFASPVYQDPNLALSGLGLNINYLALSPVCSLDQLLCCAYAIRGALPPLVLPYLGLRVAPRRVSPHYPFGR